MFNATRLRRSAIVAALTCAALATTTGAAAAAQPNDDTDCHAQLGAGLDFVPCAQEPDPQHTSTLTRADDSPQPTVAQAQERHYSSYGEPEPITAPLAPAPSNRAPWPTITLAATIALTATSIAAIHRRRLRLRRRVARATS
jgi:hypothetical protein